MKKILLPLAIVSALLVSCESEKKESVISVYPTELTFGAEGGSDTVIVTSSDSWHPVECPDWCSLHYGDEKLIIGASYNLDTESSRTGKVVIYCGDKTAEVTIIQEKDEIIEFKDEAFLQALLSNDYVDDNDDEKISKAEAYSYVGSISVSYSIYCTFPEIRGMDEIKYFVNLTGLNCNNNQLTTLDVRKNTALTDLRCYDNQLTSLDVRNNTALTSLYCGNNQLTSLDVRNNTALTDLECDGNQLTSLDISSNTALTDLDCDGNQLTSLDVRNNTALTDLECDGNQLTSLEVRNNTALTMLNCSNNQLTTLDLRDNTALTTLWCDGNQLTSLDLRNNTALTNLTCSGNPLTKIILSRYHMIEAFYINLIIEEYGDIIEYVD